MDWQPTCWTAVELTMTTAIIFDPQRSSCFCHLDPRHCWKFPCCHVLASVDIMSERRFRNIPLPSVMNNHQLASHPPRLNCPLIFHEPVCVCFPLICQRSWLHHAYIKIFLIFFPACHTHTANPTGRCAEDVPHCLREIYQTQNANFRWLDFMLLATYRLIGEHDQLITLKASTDLGPTIELYIKYDPEVVYWSLDTTHHIPE